MNHYISYSPLRSIQNTTQRFSSSPNLFYPHINNHSHDLSEIEKSADYVTMIENGKVVFNEDIDNIKGTTLEELFIKEGGDYE